VKRSVTVRRSEGGAPRNQCSGFRLVVSTTSVSPSQRPWDSPNHGVIEPGGGSSSPIRTMRTSCTISAMIITWSGVCTIV
jgi:hypothetical protein